jgi:hypothetical protein
MHMLTGKIPGGLISLREQFTFPPATVSEDVAEGAHESVYAHHHENQGWLETGGQRMIQKGLHKVVEARSREYAFFHGKLFYRFKPGTSQRQDFANSNFCAPGFFGILPVDLLG